MYEVDRNRFEALVSAAVRDLPQAFRDRIANLGFIVEDWARSEDYGLTGIGPGRVLLGVYRGIPLPRRRGYNMALPDTIVIFQQPIQQLSDDAADLADRVDHVVRHEVAHYFGISDDRLKEIDAY
jgi:predicted Zn-dependent protease with MMP-like domain